MTLYQLNKWVSKSDIWNRKFVQSRKIIHCILVVFKLKFSLLCKDTTKTFLMFKAGEVKASYTD